MTPIQLTNEILDEWLGAVELESGSSAGYSAPPEPDEVCVLPDGRSVPPELRTLWSWRAIPYRAPETGPAARPMSMTESIECSKLIQAQYDAQVRDWGPGGWSDNYLIWSQVDRIWLIVDLTELGPTSPVYASVDADLTLRPDRVAHSLGDLFAHWTALIACGAEYYDDYWTYRDDNRAEYPMQGPPC